FFFFFLLNLLFLFFFFFFVFFFFQAEDGIRDRDVTGVQTCALPICRSTAHWRSGCSPCRVSAMFAGRSLSSAVPKWPPCSPLPTSAAGSGAATGRCCCWWYRPVCVPPNWSAFAARISSS